MNKDRCPSCRRKYGNHPGLIPTCRENRKLHKAIRRWLKFMVGKGVCFPEAKDPIKDSLTVIAELEILRGAIE